MSKSDKLLIVIMALAMIFPTALLKAQTYDTSSLLQNAILNLQAQSESVLNSNNTEGIELMISTQTPVPGETISAVAVPALGNPADMNFQWFIDNKLIKQGYGEPRFEFAAGGKFGQITKLKVIVVFAGGTTISKEKQIVVSDVFLTFKPLSLVPAGYKGLNLPTANNSMSASAIAMLSQAQPSNLKYEWRLNGQLIDSGINKKTVSFTTSSGWGLTNLLSVKIYNNSETVVLNKKIEIPVAKPQVYIYPKNQGGLAIKSKAVSANEIGSFIAKTYYFDQPDSGLNFQWRFLNQNSGGIGNDYSFLNYNGPSQNEIELLGTKKLSLTVVNPKNSMQTAELLVPLNFK